MKWNKYAVKGKDGLEVDIIMGEWFKPGKYPFGEVTIIRTLTDAEAEEYNAIEDEIMSIWCEQLPEDAFEEDGL